MNSQSERQAFLGICRRPHRKMRRCFMTGKTCVYDELIDGRIRALEDGLAPVEGFMVMAYRPNLNAFYDWSLERYFRARYSPEADIIKRADRVRRTGYVICEKICRKVQESAFVLIDVSVDNPNAFYEFGIAYGLRHKMLILHDTNSQSAEVLKKQLLPDDIQSKVYAYPSLKPIPPDESFSQRIYVPPERPFPDSGVGRYPRIVVLDLHNDKAAQPQQQKEPTPPLRQDIPLGFIDVVRGAIVVSIDDIVAELRKSDREGAFPEKYLTIVQGMRDITELGKSFEPRFETIRAEIDNAFCVLIRTSRTHPFSYFWLGYCHATGKNVIPVYEIDQPDDPVEDLAFDIRSLWHLVLVRKEPTRILSELREILRQMIVSDFSEWSRKSFWSRIFGRSGRVAIFTGALHNAAFKREMVGDWDLRTASELMLYFSTRQRLASIESPIWQPEEVGIKREEYLSQIAKLLENTNAIVIASPDVNPLTELVLGHLYGVPPTKLFRRAFEADAYPSAVASVKQRKTGQPRSRRASPPVRASTRFFFIEEEGPDDSEHRGFRGNWLPGKQVLKKYVGQSEIQEDDFELYAHLVVALNPFSRGWSGSDPGGEHYIVVLNGIGGPSTFALTQLITGGMGGDFVEYEQRQSRVSDGDAEKGFNPQTQAELILSQITEKLFLSVKPNTGFCGLQMIVKVTVGPPAGGGKGFLTFDSRRVKKWEVVQDSMKLIERRQVSG